MTLKNFVFNTAYSLGLLSLCAGTQWRSRKLLILCYHGVSAYDEHVWNPALYIPQSLLARRLEWLRARRFAILPLREGLDRLRLANLPERSVSITFDDGSKDFADCAVPILRAFDAPATVYLTTYYCEHRFPVFDTALSYILWCGRGSGGHLSIDCDGGERLTVASKRERNKTWEALRNYVAHNKFDTHEKNQVLRNVAQTLGIDFEDFIQRGLLHLMTPEQVRGLPSGLVDIQLHTHRHRTPRERDAFQQELADNQAAIASITGDATPRRHFCYPSGDYDGAFVQWLTEFGVESATTCVPGLAWHGSNPLLLPRFVDSSLVSEATFAAWASGFAAMLPRREAHRFDFDRLAGVPSDVPAV